MTKHVMIASALSQIGEYATQSAAAGGFDSSDAQFTRSAITLDPDGWAALAEAARRWLAEAAQIEAAAGKRLRKSGETGMDAGLVVLLFEALPFFKASADRATSDGQAVDGQAVDGAAPLG